MADPIDLLVLSDATVQAMLADPRFLQIAPCLSGISREFVQQRTKCGKCAAKRQKLISSFTEQARGCLTSLPAQARTAVKQLLNAKRVRVVRRNGRGHKVIVTF